MGKTSDEELKRLVDELVTKLEKRTYGEVLDTLRRFLKFRNEDGEWIYRAQTDKEKEILRALDLMPKLPPKRSPGRPRKNP